MYLQRRYVYPSWMGVNEAAIEFGRSFGINKTIQVYYAV